MNNRARNVLRTTERSEFAWQLAIQWLAERLNVWEVSLWVAPLRCRGEWNEKLYLSANRYLYPHVHRNFEATIGAAVAEVSPLRGVVVVTP